MPRIRNTEDGPQMTATVAEEQRAAARRLSRPQLSPLSEDGPLARAKVAEIHGLLKAVDDEDGWADKLALWRTELRTARYEDWLNKRRRA